MKLTKLPKKYCEKIKIKYIYIYDKTLAFLTYLATCKTINIP